MTSRKHGDFLNPPAPPPYAYFNEGFINIVTKSFMNNPYVFISAIGAKMDSFVAVFFSVTSKVVSKGCREEIQLSLIVYSKHPKNKLSVWEIEQEMVPFSAHPDFEC